MRKQDRAPQNGQPCLRIPWVPQGEADLLLGAHFIEVIQPLYPLAKDPPSGSHHGATFTGVGTKTAAGGANTSSSCFAFYHKLSCCSGTITQPFPGTSQYQPQHSKTLPRGSLRLLTTGVTKV